jgi:hypothetical protein
MTALTRYDRLEATGLWRATPDGQRREVVVSVGDATLVISDMNDRALTHWSLAAVSRANPGIRPAIYHPDGDPDETLELTQGEAEMIDAIETLRRAIEKSRPRPGRLRWISVAVSVAVVAGLLLFWMPGAVQDHTLRVVPEAKRSALDRTLLQRIERVSGPRCTDRHGNAALTLLAGRLGAPRIAVLPNMTQASLHLPGGMILINSDIVEDFEEPDVAAGYILTEQVRAASRDPLADLLDAVGLRETFRLLTTGEIAPEALDFYAEQLMTVPQGLPDIKKHLEAFEAVSLRSSPYAYALDITGETTLDLIEGDPLAGRPTEPLLSDANWLRLQNICGG